ncbi:MAG: hypothetical protein ACT4P0_02290 [Panacagrimonas sp.]
MVDLLQAVRRTTSGRRSRVTSVDMDKFLLKPVKADRTMLTISLCQVKKKLARLFGSLRFARDALRDPIRYG